MPCRPGEAGTLRAGRHRHRRRGLEQGGGQRAGYGTRLALEGISIAAQVRETGAPVRVDSFAGASGPIADEARALGIRSSVGCPVVVQGRLWGVIAASSKAERAFPPETESQIGQFTELLATAIANADSREELIASRARILLAADEARRRIQRDLHDGAQQRLVHTVITLKLARRELSEGGPRSGSCSTRQPTMPRPPPRSCASSRTASCLGPHQRRPARRSRVAREEDLAAGDRRTYAKIDSTRESRRPPTSSSARR